MSEMSRILPEGNSEDLSEIRSGSEMMERVTATARGRVQGVGYRHFVAECARATGVHGTVKNLPDGTVQMIAESSPAALDDFIRLARARDHTLIHVEGISVEKGHATGEFRGFRVAW